MINSIGLSIMKALDNLFDYYLLNTLKCIKKKTMFDNKLFNIKHEFIQRFFKNEITKIL